MLHIVDIISEVAESAVDLDRDPFFAFEAFETSEWVGDAAYTEVSRLAANFSSLWYLEHRPP